MPTSTRLIKLSMQRQSTTRKNNSYVLSVLPGYITMEYHSKHNNNRQYSEKKKCEKVICRMLYSVLLQLKTL